MDLDLALQMGIEAFDARSDAASSAARTLIIVDPTGEGSALACEP